MDILQHNANDLQGTSKACCGSTPPPSRPAAPLPAPHPAPTPGRRRPGRELHIQARNLRVVREAPAVTLALDGDKLLVVLDGLSNAIDFSPDGGTIRLEASLADNRLRIDCIDQGPGSRPKTPSASSTLRPGPAAPADARQERRRPLHRARTARHGRAGFLAAELGPAGAPFRESRCPVSADCPGPRRGGRAVALAVAFAVSACAAPPPVREARRPPPVGGGRDGDAALLAYHQLRRA